MLELGDPSIGNIIAEAMKKVGRDGVIIVGRVEDTRDPRGSCGRYAV